MDNKITIVASHGGVASGLKKALEIIVGPQPDLITMDCYVEDGFDIDKAFNEIIKDIDFDNSKVCVFTDLLGGSVNNFFMTQLGKYEFDLISNVSLGVLMDYLLMPYEPGAVEERINNAVLRPVYCNSLLQNSDSDDLEDL